MSALRARRGNAGVAEQVRALKTSPLATTLRGDRVEGRHRGGGVRPARPHGEGNAGVAEQGCPALDNLACDGDLAKLIGSKGGIEAVVSALRAHGSEGTPGGRSGVPGPQKPRL